MKTATLFVLFHSVVPCALLFEPNRGQTALEAHFLARTPSGAVFFTQAGIVFSKGNKPVLLSFPGSSPGGWMPLEPSGQTTSYFVGRDRSKWIYGLASYQRLSRANLYPGIDLVLYGNQDHKLEYDLIVAPGADPARIRLRTSASATIDTATGDLVIAQSIRQHKPVVYQGAIQVEGRFKAFGSGEFGFEIGAYDRTKPLVIDPTIESQEYIGGIGDETVAAYRTSGANLVGTTTSIDFPGAPFGTKHGTDIYYRAQGGTIILGGSGNETAASFLLRNNSGTIIGGTTDSRDLPTADGSRVPFQPEYAGGRTDGFIAILSEFLTSPPRVTYFGTSGEDRITAAQSSFGSSTIVFAGSTNGINLPRGWNSDRRTLNGGFDGFVVIATWSSFDPFNVAASGYIGGASDDFVTAINPFASDAGIYIAGETQSPDFPVLNGVQSQRRGPSDGFVIRLGWVNNTLTTLSSTLLGGASNDRIGSLALLDSGDIAVGGTTSSADFPTVNPLQANYGGGTSDAFVSILAGSLARQLLSTYWGGSGSEDTQTIARNRTGSAILIAGKTTSTNFPVRNALQSRYGGGVSDGFFLHLDTAGSVLQASYFGGSGEDEISAADGINDVDVVSLAGTSNSSDLPGLPSPASLEPLRGGTKDVFVIRVASFEGFLPRRVVGAPLLVAEAPLRFGQDPTVRAAGRITATSADPSAVLVSFMSSATATSTDTSLWTSSGNPPSTLYLECQKSDVEAYVNVVVPGLQEQRVLVVCATGSLELRPPELDAPIWAGRRLQPQVFTGVVDPLTGVRTGLGRRVSSGESQNAILTVSNTLVAVLLDRFGNRIFQLPVNFGPSQNHVLQTQEPGEATITVEVFGFPRISKTIQVVPAGDRALNYSIAPGYSTYGWISSAYGSVPVSGSARTLDPSRLLLSTDNATWVNEVQVTDRSGYYILGLPNIPVGSQAQIEVKQNGVPAPSLQTVQFGVAEIVLNSTLQESITLYEGATQTFQPYLRAGFQRLSIPAGVAIPNLTAASSNVAAVPVPAPAPLTNLDAALTLTAAQEGSSTITLQAPAGLRLAADFQRPLTVKVIKRSLRVNGGVDVNLGKDLATWIPVTLSGTPLSNSPVASCTVDRSDLVRFVSGFSLVFSQDVTVDQTQLRVQGMASSGVAVVSCQVPGYPPATARVQLRPIGFVWEQTETIGATPGGTIFIPYRPAALDPATNLPLAMQEFGALSTPPPVAQVDNSNQDVLRFDTGIWRVLQSGEATLTLRQPAGLLTPAVRQRHRFATARFSTQTLVRIVTLGSGAVDGCNANPCVSLRDPGSRLTLTPRPAPGFRFERWDNNCAEICTLTVPASTGFGLSLTASFVPIAGSVASKFVTVEPCRLVDTRLATGPLGGPAIAAGGTRSFPLRGSCGIPSNATAYSLNVTVVPRGSLGYLTIWPGGQTQPVVSTLNSLDGRVKANAAIVPAGATDGSVNVFATDLTDVILDINGYFVAAVSNAQAQFLVAVPPCRVLDTRLPGGGGQIAALNTRRIRVSGGSCGLPDTARSFVLNVTAIPKSTLGYLTLWPANGSPRPTVSTLNAVTGAVTANMAIVSGASGEIDAFVTDAADLVIDVNGYFAQSPGPGTEALQFYANTSPCRVLDTRLADGPLGGPAMVPTTPRDFGFPSSNCGVPANAKAYAVNATVVPSGLLGYLTLYPAGTTRPVASTLNAVDGGITSNGAIVRSGVNGGVAAFATERTHLLIDIGGYFAP